MFDTFLLPYIFGISICEALAQYYIKCYHIYNHLYAIIIAIILYGFVCFLLYKTYDFKGMGLVNVLWSGMSVLLILTLGIVFFNEKVHLHDWIGIFLVVSGMILITYRNGTSKE